MQPTTPLPAVAPPAQPPAFAPPPVPAPARRGNGCLIAAIVLVALLLLGVVGIGAWYLTTQQSEPEESSSEDSRSKESKDATKTADKDDTSKDDTSTTDVDGGGDSTPSRTPEAVVDAFYRGLATGDMDNIRDTLTVGMGEALQASDLEGIVPASYRRVGIRVEGDRAEVDVQEAEGGLFGANTTVTFVLLRTDGEWRISEWLTAADTGDDTGGDAGQTTITEEQALATVQGMLGALKSGEAEIGKSYATPDCLAAQSDIFDDAAQNLVSLEVLGADTDGDAFVVTVEEEWTSGKKEAYYRVVGLDGKALVDWIEYAGD